MNERMEEENKREEIENEKNGKEFRNENWNENNKIIDYWNH